MFPNYDEAQSALYAQIKSTFPDEFGLRAFPGKILRISDADSYFAGPFGEPPKEQDLILYTERFHEGEWRSFAKGSVEELRRAIVTPR